MTIPEPTDAELVAALEESALNTGFRYTPEDNDAKLAARRALLRRLAELRNRQDVAA